MKITKNATFGQLYVEHNGHEYRVPTCNVNAFLTAVDLAEVPAEGIEHPSQFADDALTEYAELISVERMAGEILELFQ